MEILVAIFALMFFCWAITLDIKNKIKTSKDMRREVLCCPQCRKQFSDWFEWAGLRYCYPCGPLSEKTHKYMGNNYVLKHRLITENEGIWIEKRFSNLS